jgi:tetratricopeptide (TPR) repeat protein
MLEVLETAKKLFEERRFYECLSQLEKIEEKNQLALQHNISLCKYFLYLNESPFVFVEKLINLLKSTPKGNDFILLPIQYNLAVILYHCRQYMASISLLNQHAKITEENQNYPDISLRICLLLFCIYLKTNHELLSSLNDSFIQSPFKHLLSSCSTNAKNIFYIQMISSQPLQNEKELNKFRQNFPEKCNVFELLQANIEYNQQRYKEAIVFLENGANNLNPTYSPIFLNVSRDTFYNNIGCSYFRMGNQPQALYYYTKALNYGADQLNSLIPKHLEGLISKNLKLQEGELTVPQTSSTTLGYFSAVYGIHRPEMLANCGITLLRLGYPHYAFYCFKVFFFFGFICCRRRC